MTKDQIRDMLRRQVMAYYARSYFTWLDGQLYKHYRELVEDV